MVERTERRTPQETDFVNFSRRADGQLLLLGLTTEKVRNMILKAEPAMLNPKELNELIVNYRGELGGLQHWVLGNFLFSVKYFKNKRDEMICFVVNVQDFESRANRVQNGIDQFKSYRVVERRERKTKDSKRRVATFEEEDDDDRYKRFQRSLKFSAKRKSQ